MSNPAQLRIAARIHFVLKHELGEGIDVSAMLNDPQEAREVLFVCQASDKAELVSLGRQFVNAGELAKTGVVKPDVVQETAWARNTSGFGITRPSELALDPVAPTSKWRVATQWLRRSSTAAAH